EILREFQVQFCGLGVSVARQYYHARKRADETPLEYLNRLNVAERRAKLRVKSGRPDVLREHVKYFIETLYDRDLADQLALLRISDVDALEEVLRARQRAKNRLGRAHVGSSKYRQKATSSDATKSAPTRKVQAVLTTNQPESDSDSALSGSESDEAIRRIAAPSSVAAAARYHDAGKCRMEEFYNLIRQWYDPAKHGGVLHESAEKMLN
ncbi:hypothetical protein F443_22599, partial [Phytophthora nicotianae P1569]